MLQTRILICFMPDDSMVVLFIWGQDCGNWHDLLGAALKSESLLATVTMVSSFKHSQRPWEEGGSDWLWSLAASDISALAVPKTMCLLQKRQKHSGTGAHPPVSQPLLSPLRSAEQRPDTRSVFLPGSASWQAAAWLSQRSGCSSDQKPPPDRV